MSDPQHRTFWQHAFSVRGAVTLKVIPRVIVFGLIATIITAIHHVYRDIGVSVGPVEVAGGALVLLLVLRTNAGYERWWEGRKLWGGIVNQSRNLALTTLAYGPVDPAFRRRFVRWVATFPHVARRSLRGERVFPEVASLVGEADAERIAKAQHMPSFVALKLAMLLREARDRHRMDGFAFLAADRERAALIDHVGACERILRTPLPLIYVIKIRRILFLLLVTLPFALVERVGSLTPLVTMLLAYPVLGIDQIGAELENPFVTQSSSHLPLDDISKNIENNVLHAADELEAAGQLAAGSDVGPTDVSRPELGDLATSSASS